MKRALFLLLFASVAAGQDATETAKKITADPGQSSVLAQSVGQVTLSSSQDATDVKAEFGIERRRRAGFLVASLRLQAPLKKGAEETEFANLSGLADGTAASLRLTRVSFGRRYNPDNIQGVCNAYNKSIRAPPPFPAATCTKASVEEALLSWQATSAQKQTVNDLFVGAINRGVSATCKAYNKQGGPGFDEQGQPVILTPNRTDRLVPLDDDSCTNYEAVRDLLSRIDVSTDCADKCWVKQLDEAVDKEVRSFCETINSDPTAWGIIDNCDTDTINALENGPQLVQDVYAATQLSPTYFGLNASVKSQSFTYANPTTLAESKDEKNSVGIGATIGHLFIHSEWYVGLNVSIERGFKGEKAVEVCQPLLGTDALTCKSIALGPPAEQDKEILQVEARRYLTESLAIMPRISHDFHDDVTGYELITYLLTDEKRGLNGGVEIGYRDDDDHATVRVFVGTAFHLFGD